MSTAIYAPRLECTSTENTPVATIFITADLIHYKLTNI